ncbi:MAG: polyamine aminopropyltransferase, partial [Stackebrandtia sp.]
LYSVEFYGLAGRLLAPGGRMVVQSGSPYFAPKSYWCIDETINEAGMHTQPYHVNVPSFGDWGFHLVGAEDVPEMGLDAPFRLRSLDGSTVDASTSFPPDRESRDVPPSTLMDPVILEYAQSEWDNYG